MNTQFRLDTPDRLLRLHDARLITGHGRTAFLDAVAAGDLPSPVRIGARAVAWRLSELTVWANSRPRARVSGYAKAPK
ncbi:MAG: helix-turn-helix transcriptional regulator [Rhodanobacteraceae bacterium]